MKKSNNLIPGFSLLFLLVFVLSSVLSSVTSYGQEIYELKVYNFSTVSQEARLDKFLEHSYLPALHRAGITTVGVFKPVKGENDFGKKIYILTPFQSIGDYLNLPGLLEKDQLYQNTGKEYIDAPFDSPPYDRIETTLMKAFIDMPVLKVPNHPTPHGERIYEMRSYESATEKLYDKKVHMFNQGGEISIFEKLNFNAVFYGEVLSGSSMPNLMYMTTFPNRAVRDEYWGIFRVDPDWEILRDLKEYENTVSKIDIFFLHPADYSDI
jgi:hypothetical protein